MIAIKNFSEKHRPQYILIFFIFLYFTVPLSTLYSLPAGGFVGINPEINGYTREGFSLGGGLALGIDLNDSFSAGLKAGFFDNLDTVSAIDTAIFFRYYFPFLRKPKNTDGPFVQLEAGSAVLLERGYSENPEVFPAFSGGLSIGWRFNLGEHWYIEPAARGGYPHIWGGSLTAGIRFKWEGGNKTAAKKEIKEGDVIDDMKIISDEEGNLRLQMFSIMFRNNQADFTGLSEEIIKNNYETIRHVAEFLNKYNNYRIIIEGHANPTTAEGRAREQEKDNLIRMSEKRAEKVMEILKVYGVDPGRMSVVGAGFSKTLAPYNDRENNWKNRRVEIILIKEEGGNE
jgi:outer membrane protein OmpA-like peptidoglycan-associated protein